MENIMELLPFLIPLLIAQFALMGYTLYHVLTHEHYKHGTRLTWVILSFVNFIGPILYFLIGKEDA